MLSKVACLLVVVAAVESEVGPCERPAMLKAVKQMAPDCIDACPIICPKLNSLIMTALMGIDPTSQARYCHGVAGKLHKPTNLYKS